VNGPLAHLTVLDLSRVLAGPWCTQLLADLGATVIKVERPQGGDDTRTWGPPFLKDRDGRDTAEAAYYLACNRGKKSITLDFTRPEGREIARALSIIHMAGVIHRDLKPANIMLRDDRSIALIDFGISQTTHTAKVEPEGSTREIAGTPYYMSPEQAAGLSSDERTDLYSLGVILYQMLTGDKPYVGTTADEGVAVDQVEPLAFAWLAREALAGRPGNLPAVTGAKGLRVLGGIYPR